MNQGLIDLASLQGSSCTYACVRTSINSLVENRPCYPGEREKMTVRVGSIKKTKARLLRSRLCRKTSSVKALPRA